MRKGVEMERGRMTARTAALLVLALCIGGCGETKKPVEPSKGASNPFVMLVNRTCADIEKDAKTTLDRINAGEHPYRDKDNPAVYVFVYDPDVTIVAHPKPELVGKSMKGVPDTEGRTFRDEIVEGALEHGDGWVEYVYEKPGAEGTYNKSSYYKLVTGSDGKRYIVCCGEYE